MLSLSHIRSLTSAYKKSAKLLIVNLVSKFDLKKSPEPAVKPINWPHCLKFLLNLCLKYGLVTFIRIEYRNAVRFEKESMKLLSISHRLIHSTILNKEIIFNANSRWLAFALINPVNEVSRLALGTCSVVQSPPRIPAIIFQTKNKYHNALTGIGFDSRLLNHGYYIVGRNLFIYLF